MIDTRCKNLACLHFPNLKDFSEIRHAVFTRRGGCSAPPYHFLNTSFSVGDAPERVRHNREAIQHSLEASEIVFARQVHGTDAAVVSGAPPAGPPSVDALVSDVRGRYLAIQAADCQAVMVYDPVRRVVANIHSGWRGSIGNVIGRTLQEMTTAFGSDCGDLVAGIAPSLGPCCAEFVNYRQEIPRSFWSYKDADHHFDFWAVSHDQLRAAGVPGANIFSSRLCTRCHGDRFFSYRGQGVTGRFAAVIGLR
ncbi:MAG: peptidoglycan editing factor PgeF [Desulfobacterales bacterium]